MQYVCMTVPNLIVSWSFSQAQSTESYERCTCQLGNMSVTLNVKVREKGACVRLQVGLLNIRTFLRTSFTIIRQRFD